MNGWRVLVAAADEESARRGCRYVKDEPAFELVGLSGNAPAALAMSRTAHPDVVVLDLDLPGGLALLRRLRAEGQPVEVVAVTARADAEVVRAVLRLGAVDCLVKPFTRERLRRGLALCRRRLASTAGGQRLTQEQIDALTRGHTGRWLPRGVQPRRLEQMRVALRLHGSPLTAETAGSLIAVDRTTARRYLEYLVTVGEAQVEELPDGPGRPPKMYSALVESAGVRVA